MNSAEIRSDLLNKIEHSSVHQLKEIYGLLQNYFNGSGTEEWDQLSSYQKEKIEKGIREADKGITKPLNEVTARLRRKYASNG